MIFSSFLFYPFLFLVVVIHYLLPKKVRWVWLLFASYAFYTFSDIRFTAVLLVGTLITYTAGLLINQAVERKEKKRWLWLGICLNLIILVLFKYVNFFFSSAAQLLTTTGLQWNFRGIELFFPLGVSFYTFQAIGYLFDVAHGKIEAEKNIGKYALFISFFPKLLIGPIERYKHLQPQFINPTPLTNELFLQSFTRILWGLFKKILIADRLAVVANTIFAAPDDFYAPKLIIGVLAFAFQIYIDFSAYSDIAIGTAGLLGINLTENFKQPYFATSVTDFWRRWHISLSNWLRDYIFLPLNFKHRRKKPRQVWMAMDVMITFLISGLWHGANWTFIVWGLLHGLFQAVEILTQKFRDRLVERWKIDRKSTTHQVYQVILTFILVTIAWVFFKADSLGQAFHIFNGIFSFHGLTASTAWSFKDGSLGLDSPDLWVMAHTLLLFLIVDFNAQKHDLIAGLTRQPLWLRWSVYLLMLAGIVIFGYYGLANPENFVYFQF